MVTRSGRVSKQPERFSPQERITDDYSDEDYSDFSDDEDDVSSAVSYSTDEGRDYVVDGFVEPDDAPVDRTDDEWVPEEGAVEEEEETDESDAIEEDSETFTDDEEALKEAEEFKRNFREKDSIMARKDDVSETEEDVTDEEDDYSDLIEGEEDFTEEEGSDSDSEMDTDSEDEDAEDTESEDEESYEDLPIDPKESRKRVRKVLADKSDLSYLHELGVDPSETRNLRGVPMLPEMSLNDGENVDLTQ